MTSPEATWVCPGCKEGTDPSVNQCEHCGYLHLGRLKQGEVPSISGDTAPEPAVTGVFSGYEDIEKSVDREPIVIAGSKIGRPGNSAIGSEHLTQPKDDTRQRPLHSFLCPNPNCRERNVVFKEDNNICFNCGCEMFLTQDGREARWYEESGRQRGGSGTFGVFLGLGLCVVAFFGVPLLVSGILDLRRGKLERQRGEEMNRAAGRRPQARMNRHLGGLSGGEIWSDVGPDATDRPEHPEFGDPAWLKPFARIYYLVWLICVVAVFIVF
jgi:hypothetical protein